MLDKQKVVVSAEEGVYQHLLGHAAKSRNICQIAQEKNTIEFSKQGEFGESKGHQILLCS